jgi:hypothetical protein
MIFFYGAATLPLWGVLALSVFGGCMWDAITIPTVDDPMSMRALPGHLELRFGWSILLFAALGSIMHGFRPWFRSRHVWVHCLVTGFLTSACELWTFLMIALARKSLVFPPDFTGRVLGAGVAAAVLAPIVFVLFNRVALATGFDPFSGKSATDSRNLD